MDEFTTHKWKNAPNYSYLNKENRKQTMQPCNFTFSSVTNTLYCHYSDYWLCTYCGWFDLGELERPGSTAMSSAYEKGGSGPTERSRRARRCSYCRTQGREPRYPGACPLVHLPWALNYWGPNPFFIFSVTSFPLIIVHYWLVPSPMFVPKTRNQRGVVGSRAVTTLSLLLETPPFIGPTSSLLVNCITSDQYVTSGAGYLVPSYMHFRHKLFYTIIIGSRIRSYLRPVVPHAPYTNTLFHALLIGFSIPSSRSPFVPSSHLLINPDLSQQKNTVFTMGELGVEWT